MKKLLSKYGVIASLIVVGIPAISGLITGFGRETFALSEIVGYSSMIVAMSTVYFAMKQYKDQHDGQLNFGTGMKLGLLISSIGGLAFAAYNAVFVTWIMPDFKEKYYAYSTNTEIGTPEFEAGFNTMMAENGFMFSLLGGSILMFLTVFLIGLVLSIISAMILRKKAESL